MIGHQQRGSSAERASQQSVWGRGRGSGVPHETMTENWAVNEQEETIRGSSDSSYYGVENEQLLAMLVEKQFPKTLDF